MDLGFIHDGLRRLGQPQLLKPLCSNMLDAEGLPVPGLLTGIDRILCEEAVRSICEWEMPGSLPVGQDRDDRWRTVSSLQKAIRHGDVRAAMAAAHAGYGMDPAYMMRRLVVCAVEDVGLGNLYGLAVTLALAGSKANRKLAGEPRTAVWLAALLASGWKDRSACNLCVVVDFDRSMHPIMREWAHLPDAELSAKASALSRPVEERMLAAWLLAGTKRFWNINVPASNDRPRWSLMKLMAKSGMPLIFYWIADRAAIRGGDCMFVSFLPLWQILGQADDGEFGLRSNEPPDDPIIGFEPLLASAYDMHTRDGRTAIKRFMELPAISAALSPIPSPKDRLSALFAALFTVEGGKLNLRVSLSEIDRLHFRAISVELEYFGLTKAEDRRALLTAVRRHLWSLHQFRSHAIKIARPEETIRSAENPSRTGPFIPGHTYLPGQLALALQQAPKKLQGLLPVPIPDLDPARSDGSV